MSSRRPWDPLVQYPPNPHLIKMMQDAGEDLTKKRIEVWANSFYQVTARIYPDDLVHLSCKREDRRSIHDWRQLQEIKNTICGPDRWAVEIYPAEQHIVDTSNEYHVWVLPPDADIPFAFMESEIRTAAEIETFNQQHMIIDRDGERVAGKARQRPWQPGLSTAGGGYRHLIQEVINDAELVDDPGGLYGYVVSASTIKKLREAVRDVGT